MLRSLLVTFALAAVAALSTACASTPESSPAAAAPAPTGAGAAFSCEGPRRPLLYEVTHEQGSLHVFGSIHLGHPDFYPLSEPVESAFLGSDHLVLELDPTKAQSMEVAMEMASRGMLPAGQSLADLVGPDVHARTLEKARETGMPAYTVDRMRPWMVAVMLSQLDLQRMGYSPQDGVEAYFLSKLGVRKIVELESVEEQLALFDQIDGSVFLEYTLDSMDEGFDMARKLMASWYCGDADTLAELMLEPPEGEADDAEFRAFMRSMFYDRNARMAAEIAELLDRPGHYFVVVGAGHVVGDRGIPALLRARGVDVERR